MNIIILFLFSFISRLCALTISMTTEADAVSRTYIGWYAISNLGMLIRPDWLPFHLFLTSLSIFITGNLVKGPIFMNIIFSSLTAVILQIFTRIGLNNKKNEISHIFASYLYIFYPIAFRNSLMNVSETTFVLFLLLSLLFLTIQKVQSEKIFSLFAGLSLTVACMIRYEGWVLILPMMLLYHKKILNSIIFLLSALIFPLVWMLTNLLYYNSVFSFLIRTIESNKDLIQPYTKELVVNRVVQYNLEIFYGLTPILFILIIVGLIYCFKNRIFLQPFFLFLCMYFVLLTCSILGYIGWRGRYSLLLGVLLIPYSGILLKMVRSLYIKAFIISSVLLLIPSSSFICESNYFNKFCYMNSDIQIIPRIDNNTQKISQLVNTQIHLNRSSGVILDSLGWKNTYYIALMTNLSPDRIFISLDYSSIKYSRDKILDIVQRNPKGILIYSKNNSRLKEIGYKGDNRFIILSKGKVLLLSKIEEIGDALIYRYYQN